MINSRLISEKVFVDGEGSFDGAISINFLLDGLLVVRDSIGAYRMNLITRVGALTFSVTLLDALGGLLAVSARTIRPDSVVIAFRETV